MFKTSEIRGNISALNITELNGLMRSCGLTQGTLKSGKIASLSTFIWDAQKLALSRYLERSTSKRIPRSLEKIHASFIPKEVVSIDIGYRNLAFAHVSRTGKVIKWRRAELLKEATFEPWTLARVVEEFVQSSLPMLPASKCTYVIEHQRFRSQGSAAVTNSIMVNNLVEALLYANLRHIDAQIQTVSPALASIEWAPKILDDEPDLVANTNVEPESKSTGKKAEKKTKKKTRGRESSDKESQKEKLVGIITQMDKILHEQKLLTQTRNRFLLLALGRPPPRKRAISKATVRDSDELMLKEKGSLSTMRDLRRRLIKKERTIAVVQAWILSSLSSQSMLPNQVPDGISDDELAIPASISGKAGSTWPFESDNHIAFAPTDAEMFCDEKKKDDLCDCLTQAVAWYQWQQNTASILNRYGSALITSKSVIACLCFNKN
ncbi:hypothetical protein EV175_004657 [Coemansia sp. RSA 1933]|nr:hypothetical protein EV175_004657 [Coemansia sp. RSA 1933]